MKKLLLLATLFASSVLVASDKNVELCGKHCQFVFPVHGTGLGWFTYGKRHIGTALVHENAQPVTTLKEKPYYVIPHENEIDQNKLGAGFKSAGSLCTTYHPHGCINWQRVASVIAVAAAGALAYKYRDSFKKQYQRLTGTAQKKEQHV